MLPFLLIACAFSPSVAMVFDDLPQTAATISNPPPANIPSEVPSNATNLEVEPEPAVEQKPKFSFKPPRLTIDQIRMSAGAKVQKFVEHMNARVAGIPNSNAMGYSRSLMERMSASGTELCLGCGKPDQSKLAAGTDYSEFRTDCGEQSIFKPRLKSLVRPLFKSLFSMKKPASETKSGLASNAFCELNVQKSCADALANKDYMYYAKSTSVIEPQVQRFDGHYCRQNGFLEREIVDMVHFNDFSTIEHFAREQCDTKYAKYGWRKMTLASIATAYMPGILSGTTPKLEEAERIAAGNCAMGDLGCDISYCAYTYCKKNNETGAYNDCVNWSPVRGQHR